MNKIIFITTTFFLLMTDYIFPQNKENRKHLDWETEIIVYDNNTLKTHAGLKENILKKDRDLEILPYLNKMIDDLNCVANGKSTRYLEYIAYMTKINSHGTKEEYFDEIKIDANAAKNELISYRDTLASKGKLGLDSKIDFLRYYLNWDNPLIFKDIWFNRYNKVFFTFEFWNEIYGKVEGFKLMVTYFNDLYDITPDLYYPKTEMLNQFQTINEKGVEVLAPKILAIEETNHPEELKMLQKIFHLAQEEKGKIFLLHYW